MNLQNNFTQLDKNLQEVLEKWDKKILPFLPECLDRLARKTGAVQRKRGVCSHKCELKQAILVKLLYGTHHSGFFGIAFFLTGNVNIFYL